MITMHPQAEMWRCGEYDKDSNINQCARIFHDIHEFEKHLRLFHFFEETGVKRCRDQSWISLGWKVNFWCGFCKAVTRLQARGLDGFYEMTDHIDNHFETNQTGNDRWYGIDQHIPNAQIKGTEGR